MADQMNVLLKDAREIFQRQEEELATKEERNFQKIHTRTATGTGDISHAFSLDRCFRLVFVRCHFSGAAGTAALTLSIDHSLGSAYDTLLKIIATAGTGSDVYEAISQVAQPSPWTFQEGDAVKIAWTNPDPGNITWGLEVGMVVCY